MRFLHETTAPSSHRATAHLSGGLLFLDRESRVLHIFVSLSPFDANECTVHSGVELPAGTFACLETQPGDMIEMYRRPADPVEDDVEPSPHSGRSDLLSRVAMPLNAREQAFVPRNSFTMPVSGESACSVASCSPISPSPIPTTPSRSDAATAHRHRGHRVGGSRTRAAHGAGHDAPRGTYRPMRTTACLLIAPTIVARE